MYFVKMFECIFVFWLGWAVWFVLWLSADSFRIWYVHRYTDIFRFAVCFRYAFIIGCMCWGCAINGCLCLGCLCNWFTVVGFLVQLVACACDILIHSLGVTWRWDIFIGCYRFMSIFFHDEFFHNESDESHTHTQKGSDETYNSWRCGSQG